MTNISFPGLGLEFTVNRVAFNLKFGSKDFPIYWYSILIMSGILIAFLYAIWRAKNVEKISTDNMIDVGLFSIISAIVGARLYYVLTSLDTYKSENIIEFFKKAINIRNGGLAIYGGVIGGAIAVIVLSKIKKINPLRTLDTIGPGIILAQAIGRWGNFFNAEAHGGIVEEGHPLYFLRMVCIDNEGVFGAWHPTFLYESIWNVIGFILLTIFYKKKKFNGQIIFSYLAWYGIGRFFVEGLRTDSLYFLKSLFGETIRISQALGIICFIIFTALIIYFSILSKKFSKDGVPSNKLEALLNPAHFYPSAADIKTEAENANRTTYKIVTKTNEDATDSTPGSDDDASDSSSDSDNAEDKSKLDSENENNNNEN